MKASLFLLTISAALIFSHTQSFAQIPASEEDEKIPMKEVEEAFDTGDFTKVIELTEPASGAVREIMLARAGAFQRRGEQRFFDADIKGSIEDFDAFLKLLPDRDPHHWQRGLAYYYAGDYQKGVDQFERHQTVNTQDVENAVWHFLCVVRTPEGDFKKAQEKLIPIEGDSRVPMKEVHELFAGRGTVEDVLAAAGGPVEEGKEVSMKDRNHLCYANLYLALYFEAIGEDE